MAVNEEDPMAVDEEDPMAVDEEDRMAVEEAAAVDVVPIFPVLNPSSQISFLPMLTLKAVVVVQICSARVSGMLSLRMCRQPRRKE